MTRTDTYEGMIAETVAVSSGADDIHTYLARPLGPGPFPGLVLLHHRPGWDEWYKETARKLAYHGYAAIAPDLYCRIGHGEPDDVAALARESLPPDDQVVADAEASARFLRAQPWANGKVGVMGSCSGGRHAYLAACRTGAFDACVDLWGGGVVMEPDDYTEAMPVAPIDYTKSLSCPLLGLFGEEDRSPPPEEVARHEALLKELGKDYEFHSYPGAGHGFFYYFRPAAYRAEQAIDGWEKIWAFLHRELAA